MTRDEWLFTIDSKLRVALSASDALREKRALDRLLRDVFASTSADHERDRAIHTMPALSRTARPPGGKLRLAS